MTRVRMTLVAFSGSAILFACAIDPGPFFTTQREPESQQEFNAGRLGLLTPELSVNNELIAFRLLSGLSIPAQDQKPQDTRAALPSTNWTPTGQAVWIQARHAVTDPPAPAAFINTYRTSHSGSRYVFYLNCLDDAFETAARTLDDRRQHYPSVSAMAGWVHAQDQVFTNCSSEQPAYPEPPAAGSPPLVRADREYQIAAAHFYAGDLPEAAQRFRTIGADSTSPWQRIGAYMVGRTLLREASLEENAAAVSLAREQFARIAADPNAGSLAASARGLLEHLNALENSGPFLQSVSAKLLAPQSTNQVFANTIDECTYILTGDSFKTARAQPGIPDVFDWVQTLDKRDSAHALAKWNDGRSLPWLTLALMFANGKDESAPELLEAANRVPAGSPAHGTTSYNAVRLEIERGENAQAQKQVDALLSNANGQPKALINGWRAERMRLAGTFDDLLRWAPRDPILSPDFFDHDASANSPVLALDAAYLLNYRCPLSKLAVAASSTALPAWTAADIALAGWTRGFMLNDDAAARTFAPAVLRTHPDWASALIPAAGEQRNEWRFRAALLIAQHREFQPLIPVDYRKHFDSGQWWCGVAPPDANAPSPEVSWRLPAFFTPPETVIPASERARAQSEVDQLGKAGSAQVFLAPIIFDWANSHGDDPLVPLALHRLVMIVRYGCRQYNDPASGKISKAAFDLLHTRYPKSEWTAKTPYWFK